jgi:hypothetical protein
MDTIILSEIVKCWSCDYVQSIREIRHNDGDCIKCGVEIDLTESPYAKGSNDE